MTHIEHVTSEEMRKLCEAADYGPRSRLRNDKALANAARTFIPWALSELGSQKRTLIGARKALKQAEYAIKGREHTGFIDKAVAEIDAILTQLGGK